MQITNTEVYGIEPALRGMRNPMNSWHLQDTITISINMNSGNSSSTAWGCDLSYDYVKINGDYRT